MLIAFHAPDICEHVHHRHAGALFRHSVQEWPQHLAWGPHQLHRVDWRLWGRNWLHRQVSGADVVLGAVRFLPWRVRWLELRVRGALLRMAWPSFLFVQIEREVAAYRAIKCARYVDVQPSKADEVSDLN